MYRSTLQFLLILCLFGVEVSACTLHNQASALSVKGCSTLKVSTVSALCACTSRLHSGLPAAEFTFDMSDFPPSSDSGMKRLFSSHRDGWSCWKGLWNESPLESFSHKIRPSKVWHLPLKTRSHQWLCCSLFPVRSSSGTLNCGHGLRKLVWITVDVVILYESETSQSLLFYLSIWAGGSNGLSGKL